MKLRNVRKNLDVIKLSIYFFLIIFGPKFNSYLDLSLIINIMVIVYYLCTGKFKINKKNLFLLLIEICIMLYCVLLFLNTGTIDFAFFGKFIKVFISILTISNIISNSKLDSDKILNCLIIILLIHSVIIIIESTIFIDLQDILRSISGFDRYPKSFRGTGLTNGYDFAGTLSIVGLMCECNREKPRFIQVIIFVLASLLTSRVSMIVLEIVILYYILANKIKNKFLSTFFCVFLGISVIPVFALFLVTTNNIDNIIVETAMKNSYFSSMSKEFVNYYATSSFASVSEMHFDFSRLTTNEIIFGSFNVANQDPGYTQYIYEIGLIGLFVTLLFYIILIVRCVKNRKKEYASLLLLIISMCLVLSFKNSYLFARHITEIIIIVYNLFFLRMNKGDAINEQKNR